MSRNRCCVFAESSYFCSFVFACSIFKGPENVQNPITVQTLYFHFAVSSDIDHLSYTSCVVSVGEVTSPSYFPLGHMCHHMR